MPSKSEKQARLMAAAAHDKEFADKVGIDQSVAKEFNQADKGTKMLSNAMKHKTLRERAEEIDSALDKGFDAAKIDPRGGSVYTSIMPDPGVKNKSTYNVIFKPYPAAVGGEVKPQTISSHKTAKEAEKAKLDYAAERGYHAMKRVGESLEESLDENQIHAVGAKVRVPHKGKMTSGKVVRYDKGEKHGSPFYVVDVGEYESAKVPSHKVQVHEEMMQMDENHYMGAYHKDGDRYTLWHTGNYQYELTKHHNGRIKPHKKWEGKSHSEVHHEITNNGYNKVQVHEEMMEVDEAATHLMGVYHKDGDKFHLWNTGNYQYELTKVHQGEMKKHKKWEGNSHSEVHNDLKDGGYTLREDYQAPTIEEGRMIDGKWYPNQQSSPSLMKGKIDPLIKGIGASRDIKKGVNPDKAKERIKQIIKDRLGSHKTANLGEGNTPIPDHPYHKKTSAELHYIIKDAGEAARAMKGHNPAAEAKYLDQVNDASTVLYHRKKNGISESTIHDLAKSHSKLVSMIDAIQRSNNPTPDMKERYEKHYASHMKFKKDYMDKNNIKSHSELEQHAAKHGVVFESTSEIHESEPDGKRLLDKPTPSLDTLAHKYGWDHETAETKIGQGIKVEMEHTSHADVAREIALDHLSEDPNYYGKLKKVEKKDDKKDKSEMHESWKEFGGTVSKTRSWRKQLDKDHGKGNYKTWHDKVHGRIVAQNEKKDILGVYDKRTNNAVVFAPESFQESNSILPDSQFSVETMNPDGTKGTPKKIATDGVNTKSMSKMKLGCVDKPIPRTEDAHESRSHGIVMRKLADIQARNRQRNESPPLDLEHKPNEKPKQEKGTAPVKYLGNAVESVINETHVIHTQMLLTGKPGPRIRVKALDDKNAVWQANNIVGKKPYRGMRVVKVEAMTPEEIKAHSAKKPIKK
jgi:hypothetical protein